MRRRPRFTALLLAWTLLLALASPPAFAAPPKPIPPYDPEPPAVACDVQTYDAYWLASRRWQNATQQLHIRSNEGGIESVTDFAPIQRGAQSIAFMVGDMNYMVTTAALSWSLQFCPLATAGGAVDSATATLGNAVINSPLIALLLVVLLAGMIVRTIRRQDEKIASRLIVKLMIVAMLVAMVSGATKSEGAGATVHPNGTYIPGKLSPGWIAINVDRVLTEIVAAPAASIATEVIGTIPDSGDQMDCYNYLRALQLGYEARSTTQGQILNTRAVPVQTVSNLWQISAYNAWSVAQFGDQNTNGLSRVGCRMLDVNANMPIAGTSFSPQGGIDRLPDNQSTATVAGVSRFIAVPDKNSPRSAESVAALINPAAPAWRTLNVVESDKRWVAWATCIPLDGKFENISRRDGWSAPAGNSWLIRDEAARKDAEKVNGSKKLGIACWEFFNKPGDTVDPIFDWGVGDKEISKHQGEMPPSVYDFLTTLHGTNQAAGGTAAVCYAIGSFGVLLVYGGLGLAVVLVKMLALVMLFMVVLVMVSTLLPGANNDRLVKYAVSWLGLNIYAAFAMLIITIVTLFTKIMWMLVSWMMGTNSPMTMLVGGFLPVIAAIALHFAFKKIGLPSPMTVSGAIGIGQSLTSGSYVQGVRGGAQQLGNRALGFASGLIHGGASSASSAMLKKLGAKRNSELRSGSQKAPVIAGRREQERGRLGEQGGKGKGPDPLSVLGDHTAPLEDRRAASSTVNAELAAFRDADPNYPKNGWQRLRAGAAERWDKMSESKAGRSVRATRQWAGQMAERMKDDPGLTISVAGQELLNKAAGAPKKIVQHTGQKVRDTSHKVRDFAARQARQIADDPKAAAQQAMQISKQVVTKGAKLGGAGALTLTAAAFGPVPAAVVAGGLLAPAAVKKLSADRQKAKFSARAAELAAYRAAKLSADNEAKAAKDKK